MRRIIQWVFRTRTRRILAFMLFLLGELMLSLVVLGVTASFLLRSPRVQVWLVSRIMRVRATIGLPEPPVVPPGPPYYGRVPDASRVRGAADIYQPTNVWTVHLRFSARQWAGLGPNHVPPVPGWLRADGTVVLRNPNASRAGIAGVLGIDLPWSQASVEFGGVSFPRVGARFKGNGTFLEALGSYKRPFKLDLDRYAKGQQLAGRTVFNMHNLIADQSCLRDTLAYEFFRDAGVPAPRTAFARVFLTIDGRFERRLLGLYLLVENLDGAWAQEVFSPSHVALFKPVTEVLFNDLGDDWEAYAGIYDPKTNVSVQEHRSLMKLARLVTRAGDAEFSAGIGELIDLDEFARFLACEVLLAHYDGILAQGQNFLLYLDPRLNRFGFIPWDQDHSWGEFQMIGTTSQREQASIWHPWVGKNRFLERVFGLENFRSIYREQIARLLETLFAPERLDRRIDELASVVRPALAEESPEKLARFEKALGGHSHGAVRGRDASGVKWPGHELKRFVRNRARSVRDQLEGKVEGIIVVRGARQ
jgi:hypothetical protein